MIINAHSPDRLSFQLLDQAMTLDIISLFVCDEYNELLAKKALSEGAYLYLKKPLDKKILKYLRQFVLRKKIQREKMREGSEKNRDQMNVDDIDKNNIVGNNEEQSGEEKKLSSTEELSNNIPEAENGTVSNEKYKLRRKRDRKSIKKINVGERQTSAINSAARQKFCTEWTENLHAKFMKVVQTTW
ncbi:hypothetical protein HAX54_029594 [Datura stramonium]|uniref:Response regulatory domain-containing protein n=1 Tax=Datura stramonium TaxID=4076 RepID=A0ABS8V8D2_DATST|nr:hypothetical protein [Datura stramonium]